MNRIVIGCVLAVVAAAVFAASSFGGQPMEQGQQGMGMRHGRGTDGGCPMGGSGMMMGMGMGMGMRPQVVATPDGGVIVAAADMLMKYDKDLNLVKKVEIEIGDQDQQRMMNKMKMHQRMCRQMMDQQEQTEQPAQQ